MKWIVLLLALTLMCGIATADETVTTAAETPAAAAERDAFDDWYGSLEARSALTWDIEMEQWATSITAPVVGWRAITFELGGQVRENKDGDLALDDRVLLGLSYQVGDLSDLGVSVSWARYFTLNPMLWTRLDWRNMEFKSWGVGLNLIDLSFDNGNAAKQREDAKAGKAR